MVDAPLKDTLNSTWKNDKSRFGFKMLQKMGWTEEKGLGKNENGIVASVKVSKREEGLGLGMEKSTDGAGSLGWNATATSFNAVLQILNESYGKAKKPKKSKSSNDLPKISVGMKYKKHSAAKDLSTKTAHELRAILGAAASVDPFSRVANGFRSENENTERRVATKSLSEKSAPSSSSSSKPSTAVSDEEENVVESKPEKKKSKKRSVSASAEEEEEAGGLEDEPNSSSKEKKRAKNGDVSDASENDKNSSEKRKKRKAARED